MTRSNGDGKSSSRADPCVAEGGVRLSWMSKGTGSEVEAEGDGEFGWWARTHFSRRTSLQFGCFEDRVKTKEKKSNGDVATKVSVELKNRIVGGGEVDPEKLLAHPKNWRSHSPDQESAVEGLLEEIGWVNSVVVNKTTGRLIDGHLRVELAKKRHEGNIPVVYVELTEKEEELVLAMLDPLGDLAGMDPNKLEALLGSLDPESMALQKLISDLEEELGVGKENEEIETLLDQAVQLEPGREFVVIVCEADEEWVKLRESFGLRAVRRGGYKPGSAFDATGTERVVKARRVLKLLAE